jgi:hypothetical protein
MDVKRMPASIELHIDELRLAGFSAREGRQIGRAVERELARLIAQSGTFGHTQAVDRLDAGRLRFPAGARPQAVGARIADAVFRGLMRGPQ